MSQIDNVQVAPMPSGGGVTVSRSESRIKTWFVQNKMTLLLFFIVLIGAGLILYPTFADWWNSFHQSRAVAAYMDSVTNLDQKKYDEIITSAEEYNKRLAEIGPLWTMDEAQNEAYLSELDLNESGIMGYITIDKIHVMLPIYHGTDESALQVAIGHLSGTSLPVGGPSSHCVVSGHRGLPSAKLFTDLDKMLEGDIFTLTVLDRTLTYQVDQIRIVEPSDLSELTIIPGKDLCTLVTCTPYGINTHRLLVRGHRVANLQGDVKVVADALQIEAIYIAPFLAVPILIMLLFMMLYYTGERQRHNKALKGAKDEFVREEEHEEQIHIEK